ncbi:MAG: hypothetical protein P8181_16765 [bacterium]
MKNRKINPGAVVSVSVCIVLIVVGLIRLASYSRGAVADVLRGSVVGFLCYDPDSRLNAQFFKLLATPTVVAGVYFFFRWRNAGRSSVLGAAGRDLGYRLDFESPLLRGILTSVITVHWFAMEWWKFHVEGFYPWSPLENPLLNLAVLIASQAVAFFGMKYLSFDPVATEAARSQ